MSQVYLTAGDITRRPTADAIITLVNSEGLWFGGVDRAIQAVAGNHYHQQLRYMLQKKGLSDGQVVIADGNAYEHQGTFHNVVFVVDDLQQPLNNLVLTGLQAAEKKQYSSVALPLMRSGVMAGVVEKTIHDVVKQMKQGIERFQQKNPNSSMNITVVVYDNSEAVNLLGQTIAQLP